MRTVNNDRLNITSRDLQQIFLVKHGDPETSGWAPRRRLKFGYHQAANYYETLVEKLVTKETDWIDVGGGGSLFPSNPRLARRLSGRAHRLVGVDPSKNLDRNAFVHEHARCMIEDYAPESQFDLATLRMVAEHIEDPPAVVKKLGYLLRPGGKLVIFTVNRWAPVTVISHLLPFRLHHPVKKMFWAGEEEDTFPTVYKMNTRRQLRALMANAGLEEIYFEHLDDLSVFGRFKILNYIELLVWKGLKGLGLRYPENCLLAAYQKAKDVG